MIKQMSIPKEAQDILESITGEGFIAGGYARWVVTGFKDPRPSDIDIFHYRQNMQYNPVDTDEFELESIICNRLEELGYQITKDMPNAIMMQKTGWVDISKAEYDSLKTNKRQISTDVPEGRAYFKAEPLAGYLPINVVKPFTNLLRKPAPEVSPVLMKTYGKPEEVIAYFDFPVAMAAIEYVERPPIKIADMFPFWSRYRAIYNADLFTDDESKHLHIRHINCPIAVSMRAFKYVGKGYDIRPREIIKLFKEWDDRPVDYKKRLIELCEKDNLDAQQWFELEQLLRID